MYNKQYKQNIHKICKNYIWLNGLFRVLAKSCRTSHVVDIGTVHEKSI